MFQSGERVSRTVQAGGKCLVIAGYLTALAIGILLVAYHLFFTFLSISWTGQVWPYLLGYGMLLAVANLIYPVLIVIILTAKAWRSRIYRPEVWLLVLLMVPILIYLNYLLVESIAPYDYNL
jgi:hypothetical protein